MTNEKNTTISQAPQAKQGGVRRPLLWVVLALGAAGNLLAQVLTANVLVSIAFGLLTLACGAALVVEYRRGR
jgi:hypothetical protein